MLATVGDGDGDQSVAFHRKMETKKETSPSPLPSSFSSSHSKEQAGRTWHCCTPPFSTPTRLKLSKCPLCPLDLRPETCDIHIGPELFQYCTLRSSHGVVLVSSIWNGPPSSCPSRLPSIAVLRLAQVPVPISSGLRIRYETRYWGQQYIFFFLQHC